MRLLLHSNAPWMATGYGVQTRLLMRQLRAAGHHVAVSAFAGLTGADIEWEGHPILPHAQVAWGLDVLVAHADRWNADAIITIMDTYKLLHLAPQLSRYPLACWTPIDCDPISRGDRETLAASGAIPVATSAFGHRMMIHAGFDHALCAPHMVDTHEYRPMEDRDDYRAELGAGDRFVVGLCAANRDMVRKGFPEQFAAFARFRLKRQDAILLVHSQPQCVAGLDLMALAADFDLLPHIRFTDQYVQDVGLMDTEMMRRWYSACDVVMLCSYGEGFGLPLIEAQACGTPVIATRASAMTELVGSGWLVSSDPIWNAYLHAYWRRPRIHEIVKALHTAYGTASTKRQEARQNALRFDVDTRFATDWPPILKGLEQHDHE